MSAITASRAAPWPWRIVALLMLGAAVCHFNRLCIATAGTDRIIKSGTLNEVQMGFVYSSYLLCYTICMMPGGWVIDRFGPWAALLGLGLGSTAFIALTGLVGWVATTPLFLLAGLLAARALLGVVSAPLHPGSARMVSLWVPPGALATGNGLVTAAACVGMACTPPVFGALMDWLDWPRAFLYCAAATGLLALVWAVLASDPPRPAFPSVLPRPAPSEALQPPGRVETSPPSVPVSLAPPDIGLAAGGSFLALLGNSSLLLLTVSYAALGYFQYLFFYWSQYYFETILDLGKHTSRLYTAILILSMGLGMLLGGTLADWSVRRLGPRLGMALVPAGGLLLAALVLVPGLLLQNTILILIFFAVSMACAGASEGPFWTTAVRLGRRVGGTSAAIMNTGGNAGGLLAPVVTPLFSQYLGWQAGIGLACVAGALGAVLWCWIDPHQGEDDVIV